MGSIDCNQICRFQSIITIWVNSIFFGRISRYRSIWSILSTDQIWTILSINIEFVYFLLVSLQSVLAKKWKCLKI